jgi:hypothetical protein
MRLAQQQMRLWQFALLMYQPQPWLMSAFLSMPG